MILSNHQATLLSSLHKANSLEEYQQACAGLASEIADAGFVNFYAALSALNKGQLQWGKSLLAQFPNLPYHRVLNDYLDRKGAFERPDAAFTSTKAYDVFVSSQFFQNYAQTTAEFLGRELSALAQGKTKLRILDVGPGNGRLLASVLNQALTATNQVEIYLIEPSQAMLDASVEFLQQNLTPQITKIHCLCAKAEDVTAVQLDTWLGSEKCHLINASLSLHHMPWEEKEQVLKRLKSHADAFFLSEVDGDHDLPKDRSDPYLVASIYRVYGDLIAEIESMDAPIEDRQACNDTFFLGESIQVLSQPRETRVDYHTRLQHWQRLAEQAGWQRSTSATTTTDSKGMPMTYSAVFS